MQWQWIDARPQFMQKNHKTAGQLIRRSTYQIK